MSATTDSSNQVQEVPPFPSLQAMRYMHAELLKRQRELGLDKSLPLQEEVNDFVRCAQATGVLLEADRDRATAQTLIDYWVTALYCATKQEQGEPVLAEFDPQTSQRQLTEDQYPYCSVASQGKPALSVGTKRIVAECIDRIEQNQLVALVGPLGSGRTSVLHNGLLPALREGAALGSRHWRLYPVIMLESDPLGTLAGLFCPAGADRQQWTAEQAERLRQDNAHLATLVAQGGEEPALIAIDRFETLFTCGDKSGREALLANLVDFIHRPAIGAVVLLMKSDFMSQIDQLPEFSAIFQQGLIYLVFTTDELRQAIQGPADLVGLKFDEGLVDRLILDIQGDPATLTLLQFTLRKLWENRRGNRITWDAYNTVGGGRRAVDRAAEEVYNKLTAADQALAKVIVLRVVRPGASQDADIQVVSLRPSFPRRFHAGGSNHREVCPRRLAAAQGKRCLDRTRDHLFSRGTGSPLAATCRVAGRDAAGDASSSARD